MSVTNCVPLRGYTTNETCLWRRGDSTIAHGNRNVTTACPRHPGHCESTRGFDQSAMLIIYRVWDYCSQVWHQLLLIQCTITVLIPAFLLYKRALCVHVESLIPRLAKAWACMSETIEDEQFATRPSPKPVNNQDFLCQIASIGQKNIKSLVDQLQMLLKSVEMKYNFQSALNSFNPSVTHMLI